MYDNTSSSKTPLLQVISTSPLDSRRIQQSNANRIELVSALEIGGLTPSFSTIRKCLECVEIPTMVMVRHQNLGFCYTKSQKQLMLDEISYLKDMKVKGIVLGGLISKNTMEKDKISYEIDVQFLKEVQQSLGGGSNKNKIEITFHKAFDQLSEIDTGYNILSRYVDRILTQGGQKLMLQNKPIIKSLIKKSNEKEVSHPQILLGGGINHNNIEEIIKEFHPKEIHIGTTVRINKYGQVNEVLIKRFIENMQKAIL